LLDLVGSEVHANGETFIPLSQIPQLLQQAVIDTEGRSFYKNSGISFEGTGRSLDFSKQDILAMYLNSVYFGHGASGIKAAARIFFNKPVADLNIAQCTLLAGLPQAPTYLDPLNNYQAARFRQSEVLQSMVEAGHIYKRKVSEIQTMPLGLR
jgi:membrane peptidoglycan carboxypeptidase